MSERYPTKTCKKCGRLKPSTSFATKKRIAHNCIECHRLVQREWGRVNRQIVLLEHDWRAFLADNKQQLLNRIEAQKIAGHGACLEWQGTISNGYGLLPLHINGRWFNVRVSRLVLALEDDTFPIWDPNALARHTCDNRPCVNLNHLLPGTHLDNSRDAVERGRIKVPGLSGTDHPLAKLSSQQVMEIRTLAGTRPDHAIGAEYGVSKHAVAQIRRGRSYRAVL